MRAWLRRQKHALKPDVPCVHHRRQFSMGQGVHPSLSMASKPTTGQGVSVCVSNLLMLQEAYACMHDLIKDKGQMLPVTLMVKRHHVMACSQLGSIVRLPTLLPTLVGLLPAWHTQPCWCVHIGTCVCQCSANMSLNQYVDPTSL